MLNRFRRMGVNQVAIIEATPLSVETTIAMREFAVLMLLAILAEISSAVSFFNIMVDEWEVFKQAHSKAYESDAEEQFRMKVFYENRRKIVKHNIFYERGNRTFKLGTNEYSDMLPFEFVKTMNGFNGNLDKQLKSDPDSPLRYLTTTFIEPLYVSVPKSIDWRDKGAVTPVKNQGHCGSCWSFSATGALEGQHFRKTGKLISLSEQNLIDCSMKYGNDGCNGGLMDQAFQYVKDNRGIDTEKAYPYEGEDDKCRYKKDERGATDTGFVDVPQGDEEALKKVVASIGPVSVAIDASHESFQLYKSGVYNEPECSPDNLDHGVLVVGYGTDEETGLDYWLIKNSWGTSWGENGFVKMARNQGNMCGVASSASYPLMATHETEDQQRLRFQIELEFVQCLANPNYLTFLAQRGYFKEQNFVNYLKYLQYWKQPEYAKFLKYPMCLHFLNLLQYDAFRKKLNTVQCAKFIDDQQLLHWQQYTFKRGQLLNQMAEELKAGSSSAAGVSDIPGGTGGSNSSNSTAPPLAPNQSDFVNGLPNSLPGNSLKK
ncbi:unnamed protein product [Cyprideis torosa]|uniref:Mediator of RNA polymerase II transcription subunit 31 n=1 Tax=Cyprideis torosa TaxID=163714 RepID=A0A7R8WEW2_9CRUS|nr:unnamed protein product [Cyprideis torosa]CAG0890794.1 unnamed protein product [Cyprideis torosa]